MRRSVVALLCVVALVVGAAGYIAIDRWVLQPPTEEELRTEGIKEAARLSGNDPDVAARQMVYSKDLFAYTLAAEDLKTDNEGEYIATQLLVRLRQGTDQDQVEQAAEDIGARVVGVNTTLSDYQLLLDAPRTRSELQDLADTVDATDAIDLARANLTMDWAPSSTDPVNDPVWAGSWGNRLGGNDPSKGNWGMQAIGAPLVWQTAGDLAPTTTGVLDYFPRGVSNQDLGPFDRLDVPAPEDTHTPEEHGVHVAGTIAAAVNNGVGVAGVAPNAELSVVDLLAAFTSPPRDVLEDDDTEALTDNREEVACEDDERPPCYAPVHSFAWSLGMTYLITKKNAKLINLSLGAPDDQVLEAQAGDEGARGELEKQADEIGDVLTRLLEKDYDFLLVSAAGNASKDDAVVESKWASRTHLAVLRHPALKDHNITVGAMATMRAGSGQGLEVPDFSNEGADLVAPGVGIMSLGAGEPGGVVGWCTSADCPGARDGLPLSAPVWAARAASGTSMAAPHVTGTAAAVWGANPDLTAAEVKQIILDSAEDTPKISRHPDRKDRDSYPRLNAASALRQALATRDEPRDDRDYGAMPEGLRGTWCSTVDRKSCVNLKDFMDSNPYLMLGDLTPHDPTGRTSLATSFRLFSTGDRLARHEFAYYPPGATWECELDDRPGCPSGQEKERLQALHDVSQPRLVHKKEDQALVAGEPLVLDLTAEGEYPTLPDAPQPTTAPATPTTQRSYGDVPESLRGTWCTADGSECINFHDVRQRHDAKVVDPGNDADRHFTFALCRRRDTIGGSYCESPMALIDLTLSDMGSEPDRDRSRDEVVIRPPGTTPDADDGTGPLKLVPDTDTVYDDPLVD